MKNDILNSAVAHKYPIRLSSNINHFSEMKIMEIFNKNVIYLKNFIKYINLYEDDALKTRKGCCYDTCIPRSKEYTNISNKKVFY